MKVAFVPRLVLAAAVLGTLAGGSFLARAQSTDSDKINTLFKQTKIHALEAESDAELLVVYSRSNMSWRSHAERINEIKSHIHDLGRDFADAQALREEGSDWQKNAIDEIEPLIRAMADHLSASIKHLNENQNRTQFQPWMDYVKADREFAKKTANLLSDYVTYGESKARSEALEKRLQSSNAQVQE